MVRAHNENLIEEMTMRSNGSPRRLKLVTAMMCAGLFTIAAASSFGKDMAVTLSGDQEVPPITTAASATGTITVNDDKTVSGSIMTKGVSATAAHIHEGPKGKNGPVIIPLTKSGDNTFTVAAGAKLSDAQLESLKAGNLYVNVHSAANPGGEVRAQIAP
jgi:CHRD domain-containing protein